MTDYLRLRIEPDDDGTAELHAEVSSNGFSGVGSAWFDLRYLADFAKTLGNAFPLESPLELKGGYWAKDGTGISQEHLGIRFYPVGGTGKIGCHVRLATPALPDDRNLLERFGGWHKERRGRPLLAEPRPNNSFKPKPLRGSA